MGYKTCVGIILMFNPFSNLTCDRFFKADDSRSPLNCSPDMLKSCFTFHQVEPSFLESVYTFGDQEKPLDMCLAYFKGSHTIDLDKKNLIAVPELRRSGRDLRMSYLLRSMELDTNTSNENERRWNLRQTAVYHSFDVDTGQSFWCNIKANDEFKNRIKESVSHLNLGKPGMKQEDRVHRLFTAALSTHLIYMSWCDENWRWCINDMEAAINKILQKARSAEIDDAKSMTPEHILRRHTTMNSAVSTRTRGTAKQGLIHHLLHAPRRYTLALRGLFLRPQKSIQDEEMGHVGNSVNRQPQLDRKSQSAQHPLLTLDKFRVSELQTLHMMGNMIERSILAVQLNITVLQEISTYYGGLNHSLAKPDDTLGKLYELEIKYFKEEITNITKGLETRKTQLQSLAAQLSEGQKLVSRQQQRNTLLLTVSQQYDGLLQYRNIQIGQTFSESAETSARKMETIAYKTAQETASMHIITIVTLIFLPGTFVAVSICWLALSWFKHLT
jgi:hypothetical protein